MVGVDVTHSVHAQPVVRAVTTASVARHANTVPTIRRISKEATAIR